MVYGFKIINLCSQFEELPGSGAARMSSGVLRASRGPTVDVFASEA